jgi:hypothetical protein
MSAADTKAAAHMARQIMDAIQSYTSQIGQVSMGDTTSLVA